MYRVSVVKGQSRVSIQVEKNRKLWDVLLEHGIFLENFCNGHGTCGKCRVIVQPAREHHRLTGVERNFISEEEAQKGYRLACAVLVDEDMVVTVPERDREAVVLLSALYREVPLAPRVKKVKLWLKEPDLDDQRDDLKRLTDNLGSLKTGRDVICKLPGVLRENAFTVNAVIRKDELVDVVRPDRDGLYGMAVDIGTTTIAGYLVDLKTGKEVDVYSSLNPQRRLGADVISRINHEITTDRGREELRDLIVGEFNRMVSHFSRRNKVNRDDIYEITVVGNTTMMHMLAGIPADHIANAPYVPAYTRELEIKAREMGIDINPDGYVVMLPMVSGYIGADTVAAIMASGMYEDSEVSLLLDIGTNGEIVLGNRERMVSCSAAAGPAFEGARITFGTGGVVGAISYVDLDSQEVYKTIGDEKPLGICGSGIVDVASELIKKGIVDETGRMKTAEELQGKLDSRLLKRIVEYNGQLAFVLDPQSGILVTQKDIRELQLAKGAIAAGMNILAKKTRVTVGGCAQGLSSGGIWELYQGGQRGKHRPYSRGFKR